MYIIKCEKDGCKEKSTEKIEIDNKDTGEGMTFYLCGYHASKMNEAIKEIIYSG